MKRSILGLSFPVLLAPDSAPGLGASMTGDAALDTAVMGKLGLELEPAGEEKRKAESGKAGNGEGTARSTHETAEQKAERAAAAAEETRIVALVAETGKTREEILAEEAAALTAENAQSAEEREAKLAALVAEGKTAEEAEAEVAAEEEAAAAAAVQTPELTDEIKAWHEGQLAAKDEELTTLRSQAEEAAAKVTELTAQLESAGTQPLAIAPIDPLFLIDDVALLETKAQELRGFEAWALKHWDGVDPVEASADGKVKATPGFTAEQVRERYAQVKEVRETILPAAREGITARKAHEAQARKAYPEIFDPKRPEYKTAQDLLRLAPGLKAVLPNIHVIIGDALRGEKVRTAEERARAARGKTGVAAKKPAPKVPGKPSGGALNAQRQTPAAPGKKTEQVVNTDKFSKLMEGGAQGREALIAALTS